MACNTSTYNIGIQNVLLGKDTAQEFCVVAKADVSGSLNNKYFVVHVPSTQAKHYFWFNVNSLGIDPAVPNAVGHVIALATSATAAAVATATAAVLDGLTWLEATASGEHIDCAMVDFGYAYEARNALLATDSPKFSITVSKFGSEQVDLGATNGDISLTFEESVIDVKAPQYGDFVLAEIRKGVMVNSAFELKDTSEASWRRALNFYGSTIVTDDAASKVLSGYGSKNLFKSTEDVATQLIFRPSKNAEDANASADLTIPKARLKLGEVTFSGEDELVLPIEAIAYLDASKSSFVNLIAYGDGSAIPAV